jgi:hypothetical protein
MKPATLLSVPVLLASCLLGTSERADCIFLGQPGRPGVRHARRIACKGRR